jgi:hypothetical protein
MEVVFPTLMGGLGNQMFQLSVSYAYSKIFNKKLIISKHHLIDNPHSNFDYNQTIFKKIEKTGDVVADFEITEPDHKCISHMYLPKISGNVHLHGYFQCEKYFSLFRDDIKNLFILPDLPYYPKKNSIFLHVRRGDYVDIKLHGGYDYNYYYQNALDYIKNVLHENNINIYVLSNDIKWCKEWKLLKNYNFSFEFIENLNELESLKFMTLCDKGGICANSSFSWWGAYLNDNKDKITIFPNKWFFEKPLSDYQNDIAFKGSITVDCISI